MLTLEKDRTVNYHYIITIYVSRILLFYPLGIAIVEGSLEVKLPTIWTAEKQRWSRRIEKRRAEERRSKKRKSQKKEDPGARKGRKVTKHCVFPMICGSGGSKRGSLKFKAAGAEPAGQMRDEKWHAVVTRSTFPGQKVEMFKKCTLLWREAHFEVKMYKTHHSRTTWKLRCLKSARRCGAKHISKSKCTRHTSSGPLLEVAMSKGCTPLWREAHFEVKMLKDLKAPGVWITFGRSDVVSRGRRQGLWNLSIKAYQSAVQETCLSEMSGGPGTDSLRVVAFWSIRSSGLLR